MFLGILLRPQEEDVALWCKYAAQEAKTGRQDGKHLCERGVLSRGGDVGRNEGDPHRAEDEHAEGDELGLVEVVWKFPSQKC